MAHNYEIAYEHGKYGRRFRGSFTPSGTGVDTSTTGATRGTGFTPSYSGTVGIYRITLDEPFVSVVAALATVQTENSMATNYTCTIGTIDITNKTIDFQIHNAATNALANITASGILRRINFEVVVALDDVTGSGAGV